MAKLGHGGPHHRGGPIVRGRVLAVALLALLAGCGGFAGGNAGTPTPTLTPATVPTADPAQPDGNDHVAPERVPARHRSALAGSSYTINETVRVGPAGNASLGQWTTFEIGADDEAIRSNEEVETAPENGRWREADAWWNGQRWFYRFTWQDGTNRYDHTVGPPMRSLPIDGRLDELFDAFSVSSVEQRGNGTVLAGSLQTQIVPRLETLSAIENATMSVRVSQHGVVTRIAIGYDARFRNDTRRHVRMTYSVTEVDATTVERPPWRDQFDLGDAE